LRACNIDITNELRCWDGLTYHNIYTKVLKSWFRQSKIVKENTQTYRQQGDFISLLLFFQSKENRLKLSFGKENRIINYIM
jgi:hypothetical protein